MTVHRNKDDIGNAVLQKRKPVLQKLRRDKGLAYIDTNIRHQLEESLALTSDSKHLFLEIRLQKNIKFLLQIGKGHS